MRLRVAVLLLLAAGLAACASPRDLVLMRTYEGAGLAPQQQATVFAVWDSGDGNPTYLCEMDGHNYRRTVYAYPCPSVLYVLPGEHKIGVESHRGPYVAIAVIVLRAEPARTYEISVDSKPGAAAFFVREMEPGFTLTYKDVAPVFFKGDRVNTPIDPVEARP